MFWRGAHQRADGGSALGHWTFWAALAVLVVNDHLLKGALQAPAITGKLSDFAGLVVGPTLAAAVAAPLGRRARVVAFGAVVALFVSINVVPASARAVEAMLGAIGLPSRLWVDPTDLVALAVVPWAAWLSFGAARPSRARRVRRATVEGLAVVLGGAACLATSDIQDSTLVYVVNATRFPIQLTVRRAPDLYDCSLLMRRGPAILDSDAFSSEDTIELDPLESRTIASDDGFDGADASGPVWLQADGLDGVIICWEGLSAISIDDPWKPGRDDSQGIVLRSAGRQLVPAVGSALTSWDASDLGQEPTCDEAPGLAEPWVHVSDGDYDVQSVGTSSDRCLDVYVSPTTGVALHLLQICAPLEAFPFVAGDQITVSDRFDEMTIRDSNDTRRSVTYRLGVTPTSYTLADCSVELPCGAVVIPLSVSHAELGFPQTLGAGESVTSDDGSVQRTLFILRAEQVAHLGTDCNYGRATLGPAYDSALLEEPLTP